MRSSTISGQQAADVSCRSWFCSRGCCLGSLVGMWTASPEGASSTTSHSRSRAMQTVHLNVLRRQSEETDPAEPHIFTIYHLLNYHDFASQVTFLDVKVSDAGHRPAQPFKTSCRYAHSALICANCSWFGSFMQQMETVMHMKSRWQLRDDCPFLAQHSVVHAACPRVSTCTRRFGYVGNSWRIWRSGKHRTTRDPSYRLEWQTWQKGIVASKAWTCTGSLYHVNSQHVNLSTFSFWHFIHGVLSDMFSFTYLLVISCHFI